MTDQAANVGPATPFIRTRAPEEFTVFRLAQLAILLEEIAPMRSRPVNIERLGYYDFFAANPFAMFGRDDESERARLHHASFDERQLAYASTGSRFANRRKRLQHDFALLIAYRIAERRDGGYGLTAVGEEFVSSMTAFYADQYRESVRVVHSRLKNLSDTQLGESARRWLRTPSLMLDLYGSADDAPEAVPRSDSR